MCTLPPLLAHENIALMPVAPGVVENDAGQRRRDVARLHAHERGSNLK
jgi:hypothetical protein